MTILENISLKPYNTFGIDAIAKQFVLVNSFNDLKSILSLKKELFLLSGGSNMLLTKNIEKLVVHLNLKGITTRDLE